MTRPELASPPEIALEAPPARPLPRVRVAGKFFYAGDKKLYLRGVTYGTFAPNAATGDFPEPDVVAADFTAMVANGINALRTYSVPPTWLLDLAAERGLRVMVGLAWEEHIALIDNRRRRRDVEQRVRAAVRACAGHDAVFCYAVGNEIPASIVRWHGARKVQRFIERLTRIVREEDPAALVTYVNYPSTEYLEQPGVDFVSFNVYVEQQAQLEAYVARLQNLAGDRPLLIAELGLDSRRAGLDAQAETLEAQVRTSFAEGCAGVFVYAWTDEWHRGSAAIEDWDFGLTTRERAPKPALTAVREAFADVPFAAGLDWPRISVVVCSYNGARTVRDTLEGLRRIEYPDYEVIVVNDGSRDATAAIAAEYDVRIISTENRGLSAARNTGAEAATGEIVAYIDDDAYPDPHWLHYLARTYMNGDIVAAGGPNIPPPGDGFAAECVANAPGGPLHVLVGDRDAEHVPGCNLSVRRDALAAVDWFDPRFRTAGDDVDLCWRLRDRGWSIGFHAGAMVWHHRRNSLRAFWRQQVGYGRAEALLEGKWPERYNASGHLTWAGRLYGNGITRKLRGDGGLVYHGAWNSALFQSVYQPSTAGVWSLPLMPEWWLIVAAIGLLSAIGVLWLPLLAVALPLFALTLALPLAQAFLSALGASYPEGRPRGLRAMSLYLLTAMLHIVQPLARLRGRMRHGLTPWRRRPHSAYGLPRPRTVEVWTGEWRPVEAWIEAVRSKLQADGVLVLSGGAFDIWDLEARAGMLASARLTSAVEEHGRGVQRLIFRVRPRLSALAVWSVVMLGGLAAGAALTGPWVAAGLLGGLAALGVLLTLREASLAAGVTLRTVTSLAPEKQAGGGGA